MSRPVPTSGVSKNAAVPALMRCSRSPTRFAWASMSLASRLRSIRSSSVFGSWPVASRPTPTTPHTAATASRRPRLRTIPTPGRTTNTTRAMPAPRRLLRDPDAATAQTLRYMPASSAAVAVTRAALPAFRLSSQSTTSSGMRYAAG